MHIALLAMFWNLALRTFQAFLSSARLTPVLLVCIVLSFYISSRHDFVNLCVFISLRILFFFNPWLRLVFVILFSRSINTFIAKGLFLYENKVAPRRMII